MNGLKGIIWSPVKNGAAHTLRRHGEPCGSFRTKTPYPLQPEFSRGRTPLIHAGPIRVTLLVGTYNCDHFIEEAIDSVPSIPPGQMEIRVVDDGSTDDTAYRVNMAIGLSIFLNLTAARLPHSTSVRACWAMSPIQQPHWRCGEVQVAAASVLAAGSQANQSSICPHGVKSPGTEGLMSSGHYHTVQNIG